MTIYQRMTEYEIIRRQEQKIEKLEEKLERYEDSLKDLHAYLSALCNIDLEELSLTEFKIKCLKRAIKLIPVDLFKDKQEG